MSEASPIVFAVSFAVYSLAIVAVGLYSARFARKSDEDYFLADRSLGSWVAALSASASSESGWVTLGLVGWAFTNGVRAYWIIPGCLLGFAFNWFVVAGRLSDRSRALGALTIPDFFALHFKERLPILRILSVVVITLAMLLYVSAQLAGAGKSFSASFDNLDYRVGVLIGAAIVLAYTVSGGFRAVCWTDFMQSLLMVGALVLFPVYMMFDKGGYGFISEQLGSADSALLRFTPEKGGIAFLGFLLGSGAMGINFGYPGQPHVLIRFMALKSRREAFAAGFISLIWGALVYWGAVTVGLMARSMLIQGAEWTSVLAGTDGEQGLILAARYMLPGIVSGIVLAAVLAAICSTADSQLVVAASAVANDLYSRLLAKDKRKENLLINRAVVFGLGVVAVLLVIDKEVEVYSYVLTYGWAILGASFGPQMILALFWKRASYAGCIAGMSTGFALAIIWAQVWNKEVVASTGVEIYNLSLAFVCALAVNVVVSLLTGKKVSG